MTNLPSVGRGALLKRWSPGFQPVSARHDGGCDARETSAEQVADFQSDLAALVARFSLAWLVAANLVGIWMALLLVKPEIGDVVGEFSYGRWVPLHLDWHLYGWCSLPPVGALFAFYLRPGAAALRQARWALLAWSAALLAGGLSWLGGHTTGKLFLDWTGLARLALIAAQTFLWGVLAFHWWSARAHARRRSLAAALLLAALASVPAALVWATGRNLYPAIDPGTGGPTGASLLGSTLGIILIFSLTPKLLGLRSPSRSSARRHWLLFGLSCALFAALDHRQSSHGDWRQIAGLGALLAWIPLLGIRLRGFRWEAGSCRWLTATLWWWGLLVLSGFFEFCPGILDRAKFTHALVAHSHLAMAGLLTSFNMLVLSNLGSRSSQPLVNPAPFALWHFGLAAHLFALAGLAVFEASDPAWLLQSPAAMGSLYLLRLVAGIVMTVASIWWLAATLRGRRPEKTMNPA